MEHVASTVHRAPRARHLWACSLLLASVAVGCGTSNAVIAGVTGGAEAEPMAAAPTPRLGSSNTAGMPAKSAPASAGRLARPTNSMGGGGTGGAGHAANAPRAAAAGGAADTPDTMPPAVATMMGGLAQAGMPAAASGAVENPPQDAGCRASPYSLAVRLTLGISWKETTALMAGSGSSYVWTKLTIDPAANQVSEYRLCGGLMPIYQTNAVAGNTMLFQRVPQAAYDMPSMPKVSGGSATRTDAMLALDPGILLAGVSLPDPAGPWPMSATDPGVMAVDADDDGKPGLTSQMRNDERFTGSPTSIIQSARVDANYVANRLSFRATLDDSACADALQGTVELLAMDTIMLGCHVKDGPDCTQEEYQFIDENRPKFMFATEAIADVVVVPVDATCAQVVEVLDIPAP